MFTNGVGMDTMRIAILGAQGSGKGTQAARIAETYGLVHIDMGALLRERAREDSEMGRRIRLAVDAGEMVPDEIPFRIFSDAIANAERGFVADGYPRNERQLAMISERVGMNLAVYLRISDEVALERIRLRRSEQGRDDDTDEVVRHRLELYHKETELLLRDYHDMGILVEIDGEQSRDAVFSAIQEAIKERFDHS